MTGRSLAPFQQSIYSVLSGNSELMALVTGLYDHVPYDAALPYLVFANVSARSEDGIVTRYERVTLGINCYSQNAGRKECDDVVARVSELLHRNKQPLGGGDDMVWQRVTRASVVRLADGKTWRGEVEVTALIEMNE